MLTDIVEQIESGSAKATRNGGMVETGVPLLPKLPRDAGDRNRTSPFAFTGNKFEFRAVGSSQSIAFPAMVLNLAVADSLDWIATELEGAVGSGRPLKEAVEKLLCTLVRESRRIIFNGNNYATAWHEEAEKRGLLNLKTSVDAFAELLRPEVIQAFERHKILSERELRAHFEVNVEAYCKTLNVEAQLMVRMANRYILPAAIQYQTQVADAVNATKAAGVGADELAALLVRLAALVGELRRRTDSLAATSAPNGNGSGEAHARHMRDQVVPAMAALRETADTIETLVPHEIWPLPTYREMLFIK
jgi:glutamine synthetase